ncbi:MAG: hypothetical protein QXI19_07620 [Candidatus Caldarchaeum sp.]
MPDIYTVIASQIEALRQQVNYIRNPSVEVPDPGNSNWPQFWFWGSGPNTGAVWDTEGWGEGWEKKRSLRLTLSNSTNFWQQYSFPVTGGAIYRFGARFKGSGSPDVKLTMRFFDASDNFLGEVDLPLPGTFTSWTIHAGVAQAPATAAKADIIWRATTNTTCDLKADDFFVTKVS